MLPQFPNFKSLELSDRSDIEAFTSKHKPYSNYNFKELWTWDIDDSLRLSQFNGNLLIQFTDYATKLRHYSFMGENQVADTVSQIFKHQAVESNNPIKYLPEDSTKGLDPKSVEVDYDNSDYIYDLAQLAKYDGPEFKRKRVMYNKFLREYDNPQAVVMDPTSAKCQSQVRALTELWGQNKPNGDDPTGFDRVFRALTRFLEAGFSDTICIGVELDGRLAGFGLYSVLPQGYAMCHFLNGDVSYDGIYEFLVRESSVVLLEKGSTLLNYQEDLGLANLRFSKNSYNPVDHLRNFTIQPPT